MSLVLAGGEVSSRGLEERVRSAVRLVFLKVDCCLCGIAALKSPEMSYRKRISTGAGTSLPTHQFPYELGWVFVMPSFRGRHFSVDLTKEAISAAGTAGVFATSRVENKNMHATLHKFEFSLAGKPFASNRGDYLLQMFVRYAAQQTTTPAAT